MGFRKFLKENDERLLSTNDIDNIVNRIVELSTQIKKCDKWINQHRQTLELLHDDDTSTDEQIQMIMSEIDNQEMKKQELVDEIKSMIRI